MCSPLGCSSQHGEMEVKQHHTLRYDLLWFVTEDRLQTRPHHVLVSASDCCQVPSRIVRASYNHCQPPSPTRSAVCVVIYTSWKQELPPSDLVASLHVSQTLEQFTIVTPRSDIDSRCPGRRLSTWQMIAASCLTVLSTLCGQLTSRLAFYHEHTAAMATELLQPLDLVCGTRFSCAIQTSPTDCLGDS